MMKPHSANEIHSGFHASCLEAQKVKGPTQVLGVKLKFCVSDACSWQQFIQLQCNRHNVHSAPVVPYVELLRMNALILCADSRCPLRIEQASGRRNVGETQAAYSCAECVDSSGSK